MSNILLQSPAAIDKTPAKTQGVCPTCGPTNMWGWLQGTDRFNGRSELYQLIRCPKCSLVLLKDPPRASEMGQHYGPCYDRFIGKAGDSSPERWKARRKTILQHRSGGALLDLGCSSGSFLESMKGSSWQLFGIEVSIDAAKKAHARSGGQVFVGDILEADFPAESFDVITCFDVLEHVYDPRAVMAKVREWLKPDGVFYFLVPNIDSAEARIFRSYWYGLELPRHLTHFSPNSLRVMARLAGLKEVSLSTGRNPAFEYSMRYVIDDLLQRLGISRTPLFTARELGLPWRVVRKALRMSILPVVRRALYVVGAGESIHAVFTRDALSAGKSNETCV